MNNKLNKFLDEAFKPYGNFPARNDVQQELLANLTEKYNDLIGSGKPENEAFQITTESFGDVSEIMEQITYDQQSSINTMDKRSMKSIVIDSIKHPIHGNNSRFRAADLQNTDLAETHIPASDFSMSALMGSNFDNADIRSSKFKASALKGASFVESNLSMSQFNGTDLTDVNLSQANLSNVSFHRCAFKGAIFNNAILDATEFKQCDLSEISFDGLTLHGTVFDGSSLKKATFSGTVFEDVSFHHSDVKYALFDGAKMDKVTYALLKGHKANLGSVTLL